MADSKLRLSIVTALDSAGLKMTKEQIDAVEQSLNKLNKDNGSSGLDGMSKSALKLHGNLGKVVESLGAVGKAAGAAGLVVAVFKEAYEVGQKMRAWLGERIECLQTEEQLLQKSLEYEQQRAEQYNQELDLIKKVAEKKTEIYSKEQVENDKSIKQLDDKTKAYFRQVEAINGLNKNIGNAKAIQLERAKFEDMLAYQNIGENDAAEQIGKAYDVAIQQLKVEDELKNVELERGKLIQMNTADEDKFLKKMEAVQMAESRLKKEEEKLAQIGKTDRGDKYKTQLRLVENLQNRLENRQQQAAEIAGKLQENKYLLDANSMNYANVAASGSLAVDKLAADYDQFVMQNNNPLGYDIDQSWADELLKNTADSNHLQNQMLETFQSIPQMLEQLLMIKQ